jgi:hypothetical protein
VADFCPYGSEPGSGAPTFFVYEGADLAGNFPYLGGFVALAALDLPSTPQVTAEFCALGPPTDLATDADVLAIASPPIALATGAFRRIGNSIKAAKWAELCACKPLPTPPAGIQPLSGFSYWQRNLHVHWDPIYNSGEVLFQTLMPLGIDAFAVRTVSGTWPQGEQAWWADTYQQTLFSGQPAWPGTWSVHIAHATHYAADNWQDRGILPAFQYYLRCQKGPGVTVTACDAYVDVIIRYPDPQPTYTPDPLPAEPTDYPAAADGPCDAATTADLCRAVNALAAKVEYLVNETAPPQIVPADEPVLAVPSDPVVPVGTPDVPLAPIDKPVGAIGVIVQCTVVPASKARFGGAPLYYPDLAHVILLTASGPLASIRITHNPQVILSINNEVTQLVLDPSTGVVGQVQWLMGYQ